MIKSIPWEHKMLFGGGNTGRLRNHPNNQNTLQEIISNHPRFKAKDSGWREAVSVEVVNEYSRLLPNEKELGLNTARDWVDIVSNEVYPCRIYLMSKDEQIKYYKSKLKELNELLSPLLGEVEKIQRLITED